jgi:hypothetical protein
LPLVDHDESRSDDAKVLKELDSLPHTHKKGVQKRLLGAAVKYAQEEASLIKKKNFGYGPTVPLTSPYNEVNMRRTDEHFQFELPRSHLA